MKLRITILLAAVAALLFPSNNVSACSCVELTPCQAFGHASAVFIGRMIEGTEKVREYTKDGKPVSYEAGKVRFAVEESFKGVTTAEITILVLNMRGTSCDGTALGRGEKYLVYATYSDSLGLSVGPCSPTKLIERAETDLEFLRNLPSPGVGGRLYGRVAVETGGKEPLPLADVMVTVEDEAHQRIQVKTDKDGNYELNGLKPGRYTASPVLPQNYIVRDEYQKDRELLITDRGCANAPFWATVDGRISGRVTDSNGRGGPADLRLVSVGQPERRFYGYTEEDGQYEIHGVPPGTYLLCVDLIVSDKEKPYFHPGVEDRGEATVIKIGMGQKLTDFNFRLPPELQVITLTGIVNYSDGRPAVDAEVRLAPERGAKTASYRANQMYTAANADEMGRFTIQGYKDVTYRIIVIDDHRRAIEEKRTPGGRAIKESLVFDKDTDGVKVVLPLEANPNETQTPQSRKNASGN